MAEGILHLPDNLFFKYHSCQVFLRFYLQIYMNKTVLKILPHILSSFRSKYLQNTSEREISLNQKMDDTVQGASHSFSFEYGLWLEEKVS